MMSGSPEERRREKRFLKNELPKVLQSFMIDYAGSKPVKAETLDASANGISLLVPVSCGAFSDPQITITSLDQSLSLTDDILYIQSNGSEASRLSIMFSKENFLKPFIKRP